MNVTVSRWLVLGVVLCLPASSFGQLFGGRLFDRGPFRGPERTASLPTESGPHFTETPERSGARMSSGIVPGTGDLLERALDDFEDEDWAFTYNLPKSSHEQDKNRRYPLGVSENGLWKESTKRGTPDHVVRVDTPAGGLAGSDGAMKIQTLNSGIPRVTSYKPQQDDLILSMQSKYGQIPVYRAPNVIVRVWLPPFEEWEPRSGSHFGFRLALNTTKTEKKRRFIFKRTVEEPEDYWPGFFIQFTSKSDGHARDGAMLLIRGASNGGDFPGPSITRTGWWTLGMTVNPNGSVSYYASPGVDPLNFNDHIATTLPYSYHAESFSTIFFNITSSNNGRTWSTPFIIDDPMVFVAR